MSNITCMKTNILTITIVRYSRQLSLFMSSVIFLLEHLIGTQIGKYCSLPVYKK